MRIAALILSYVFYIWRLVTQHYRRVVAVGVWALAMAAAIAQVGFIGLSNSQNTLLHYAVHLLRDGGLYQRWMEVNPPLIILIYSLPAAAILALHVTNVLIPAMVLHGYALILCAVSIVMLWQALRTHKTTRETQHLSLIGAAYVLLIIPSMCDSMFADREHLLFVFTLPWVIQMLMRLKPLPYTTLFAAIGFIIKPFNLLIALTLILLGGPSDQTFRQRIFSPSSWVFGCVAFLYAVIVWQFFPGYAQINVPLALVTYPFIEAPLADRIHNITDYLRPYIGLATVYLAFSKSRHWRQGLLWLGFIASVVIVYVCNGGWVYTKYLVLVPLVLLCTALWSPRASLYASTPPILQLYTLRVVIVLIVYSFTIASIDDARHNIYTTSRDSHAADFHRMPRGLYYHLRLASGQKFILLSTELWGANLETTFTEPPYHVFAYDYLWPLPWLMAHPTDAKAPMVREALWSSLRDALAQRPAPTLIVDESVMHREMPQYSDILGFFRTDPQIRTMLKPYTQVEIFDTCSHREQKRCRFSVWNVPSKTH